MSWELQKEVLSLDLPPNEREVLRVMASHVPKGSTRCYPGVPCISHESGYSERQVERLQALLKEKGLIVPVAYERGGKGKATEYELHLEKGVKRSAYRRAAKGDILSESVAEEVPDAPKGDKMAEYQGREEADTPTDCPPKGDILSANPDILSPPLKGRTELNEPEEENRERESPSQSDARALSPEEVEFQELAEKERKLRDLLLTPSEREWAKNALPEMSEETFTWETEKFIADKLTAVLTGREYLAEHRSWLLRWKDMGGAATFGRSGKSKAQANRNGTHNGRHPPNRGPEPQAVQPVERRVVVIDTKSNQVKEVRRSES